MIDFQRQSFVKAGIEVDNFPVKGGGKTYLTSIFALKKYLKTHPVDVVHAHYSFSGFVAALATRKPVVCSLMGSDVLQQGVVLRAMAWLFYKFIWKETIVKNKDMQKRFPDSKVSVPNGVDFLKLPALLQEKRRW